MAKYIGPKTKIARKFGEAIYGEDRSFEKRNYPPGQHGMARRRAKRSEYATQLQEKQKAKYTYGILERQFHNIFEKAQRASGITGEILLQLCESRLDNVVYRLGIAPTRSAARQLVGHRHITVNGEVVNIPSYCLKAGDKKNPNRWKLSLLRSPLANPMIGSSGTTKPRKARSLPFRIASRYRRTLRSSLSSSCILSNTDF